MIIVIEVLLVAATLAFIGYPILKKENDLSALVISEEDLKEDLIQKKEYVYMNLRDLETDHDTGKISNEDYLQLKRRYEHEAIEVMKEIDHVGDKKPSNQDSKSVCQKCGQKLTQGDQFCASCGTKLG